MYFIIKPSKLFFSKLYRLCPGVLILSCSLFVLYCNSIALFFLPLQLNCTTLYHSRMRTQACGSMDRALGQCLLFPARTMASRVKISNTVGSDKASSLLSNLGPLVTQISITHRQGCLWNISNKIKRRHRLAVHKAANLLSSPNSYGKTVTNLGHLLVFQGRVASFKSGQTEAYLRSK